MINGQLKYFRLRELDAGLKSLRLLVRTQLWAQVFLGLLSGIAVGLLLSPDGAALVEAGYALAVAACVVMNRWLADVDAGPASQENSPPAERPEE